MTDKSMLTDKSYHMKRALLDFISAGNRLTEVWDENSVVIYPEYLPAFEDFIFDFANLMTEPEAHFMLIDLQATIHSLERGKGKK